MTELTTIERIANECAGFTGKQRRHADARIHRAMADARRNILATWRRPERPIMSENTPWDTKARANAR